MRSDLTNAINLLNKGQYTCVLCKESATYRSTERGVKPLVDWLESNIDLEDFSVADRVAGKAAAFLYILMGVKEVYADVMTEECVNTLEKHGIKAQYNKTVKNIINRKGTDLCPMEKAVKDIFTPDEAFLKIKQRLSELSAK